MNKTKKKVKGFTLIELMIVVAVIGVLAAIAVPQYQDYVKKGAFGTALASASAYKTKAEDSIAFENEFPFISASFGIGNITAASGAVSSSNNILAEVTQGGGTGSKIKLSRSSDGNWTCKHNGDGINVTGCSYDSGI
ncbi:pilin [Vibrio mexicanus]|uniref:pilin n=1 Tax=Vibrio mexicanus TaxID=1004326 RepID=UPI00063C8E48|nr:pilin [Vibrio mexicanus]